MKHPFALLPIVVLVTVFALPTQGAKRQQRGSQTRVKE